MRKTLKFILPLMLLAALILTAAACHRKVGTEPTPSISPMTSSSPSATASAKPSDSPKATEGMSSTSPSGSPDASGMPTGDPIEGFVEGKVLDPSDVPHVVQLLSQHSDYRGLSIQSITYKLREGRQAYYVILQGEGDASRRVYVFADDSIVGE